MQLRGSAGRTGKWILLLLSGLCACESEPQPGSEAIVSARLEASARCGGPQGSLVPSGSLVAVWGPIEFVRTRGKPDRFSTDFDLPAGALGRFSLIVDNRDGVSSAMVSINGATVFGTRDFHAGVPELQRIIDLQPGDHRLEVELRGEPGRKLVVWLYAAGVSSAPVRVDVDGAQLSAGGVTIDIPAGAVEEPIELTLAVQRSNGFPAFTVTPDVRLLHPAVVTFAPSLWTPTGPAYAYRADERSSHHVDDIEMSVDGAHFSTSSFSKHEAANYTAESRLGSAWSANTRFSWDKKSDRTRPNQQVIFPNTDICYGSTSSDLNHKCGHPSDCRDVRGHLVRATAGTGGLVAGADDSTLENASLCGDARPFDESLLMAPELLQALTALQARVDVFFGGQRRLWLNGAVDSTGKYHGNTSPHYSGRALDLDLCRPGPAGQCIKVDDASDDLGWLADLTFQVFKDVARSADMPDDIRLFVFRETGKRANGTRSDHVHVDFTARCSPPKSQWDETRCVGPSGFLVTPSYLPRDGISGPRLIQAGSAGWKLSNRSGAKAGNLDWKGWYKAGQPSKVLTWWGSGGGLSPRYSTERFAQIGGASPEIYANGELHAVAPGNVLGAALNRSGGEERIIAVCDAGGGTDVVYARPNESSTSPGLYDPVLEPRGWKELGRFTDPLRRSLGHNPWFFNGEGTEAQTIRRQDATKPEQLSRLKFQVSGGVASFSDQGNLDGLRVTQNASTTEQNKVPSPCEPGSEGTAEITKQVEARQQGEYVVAVDYRDSEEILAKVVASGTGRANAVHTFRWRCGGSGNVQVTDEKEQHRQSGDFKRELVFGSQRIPLDNRRDDATVDLIWSDNLGGLKTGMSQARRARFSLEQLAFFDLRHELWAGVEFSEPVVTGLQTYDSDSKLLCTQTTDFVDFQQLVAFGSQRFPISQDPQDYSQPQFCQSKSFPTAWLPDLPGVGTIFPGLGTMRNIIYPRSNPGSWVVSSAGKLAVSQEISGFGGVFNYLTGGDLSNAVPGDPGGSPFYPISLLR